PEAERIDAVFDAVMVLVETVAQIAGGKRIRPTRAPRPETAAQKLEQRKRLEKVYALADKMPGGRGVPMATAYSVGTTFSQVLPSFDNFHKRAAREMRKIGDLKVDVDPRLRDSGIQRELDRISRDRQVNIKANLQDEELKAKLRGMEARRSEVNIKANLQDEELKAKLRAMEARRSEINIKVDADIAKAEARIRELEGKRGETKIDVDAEIAKAKAKIESL